MASDSQAFLKELKQLEQEFDASEPELAEVVRDPAVGVEGFVVVWNTEIAAEGPLGPCGKGGTRVTPTVTLEETKALAKVMALKNAAAGLPLGGAKSGLRADSRAEGFEEVYRRFISLCRDLLRENGGIFGGFGFDLGARPEMPLWACDELGSLNSFTGKPVEMGGTDYDREGIAGLGVAVSAKTLLEFDGVPISSVGAAIQGVGAMGAAVARYYTESGGRVLRISDPRIGGTVELGEQGASEELLALLQAQDFAAITSYLSNAGFSVSSLESVLYEKCDLLFPCAVQDTITAENMKKIQTSYLVEGANYPCTPEAQTYLYQQGVRLIPDFIANPGGIIAAFVELTSAVTPEENAKTRQKVEDAKAFTRATIRKNVTSLLNRAEKLSIEPRLVGKYDALVKLLRGNENV